MNIKLLTILLNFSSFNHSSENQIISSEHGSGSNNTNSNKNRINENQTKVKFEAKFTLPFVLKIIATQSMIDNIGHKFINAFANQLLK